jgi:hypothetical protein
MIHQMNQRGAARWSTEGALPMAASPPAGDRGGLPANRNYRRKLQAVSFGYWARRITPTTLGFKYAATSLPSYIPSVISVGSV